MQVALCGFIAICLWGPLNHKTVANGYFAVFFLAYAAIFLDRLTIVSGWYQHHPGASSG